MLLLYSCFTIVDEVLSLFFPLAKTVCTSVIVYCACHMQSANAYMKHTMAEGFVVIVSCHLGKSGFKVTHLLLLPKSGTLNWL